MWRFILASILAISIVPANAQDNDQEFIELGGVIGELQGKKTIISWTCVPWLGDSYFQSAREESILSMQKLGVSRDEAIVSVHESTMRLKELYDHKVLSEKFLGKGLTRADIIESCSTQLTELDNELEYTWAKINLLIKN